MMAAPMTELPCRLCHANLPHLTKYHNQIIDTETMYVVSAGKLQRLSKIEHDRNKFLKL